MRLLVDSSAGRRLAVELAAQGHDVLFARDLGPDPGDEALAALAVNQDRVIITVDQGFGLCVVQGKVPDVGIVFIPDVPFRLRIELIQTAITHHQPHLESGCWVVVSAGRMRLRHPPHDPRRRDLTDE